MIKFFSKRINNKKGFTLVELLVVIAVLGILALIAIPRLGAYRRDAGIAANVASAASVYNGAQAYLAKHLTLDGYDYTEYLTGALPNDAVVTVPTLEANGVDLTAAVVSTNNGNWEGVFPPAGAFGGGSQVVIDIALPRIEAETASLFGTARVQSSTPASGGQVIGHLIATGDGLEITVDTTDVVEGEATLVITYSRSWSPSGELGLYINDTMVKQIVFPRTFSWHTFSTVTESITLDHTLASNTIGLYFDGQAVDVDCFDLTVKKYE